MRLTPLFFAVLFAYASSAQNTQTPISMPLREDRAAKGGYADSVLGMQSQMDDLANLMISSDQKTYEVALDTLAIPKPHEWLAAHFPAYSIDALADEYDKAFARYRQYIQRVMSTSARNPNFRVMAQGPEIPGPLVLIGVEALLPQPDSTVHVEQFYLTPTTPGSSPWVGSFVFVDGRFRFVGGYDAFWNERITALRGPMSIPPKTQGNLTVQALAFHEVDPKTPGILAVVVMDVTVAPDGRAHFKVKYGNPQYIKRAEEYVIQWGKYPPMAAALPLDVVFFTNKH